MRELASNSYGMRGVFLVSKAAARQDALMMFRLTLIGRQLMRQTIDESWACQASDC